MDLLGMKTSKKNTGYCKKCNAPIVKGEAVMTAYDYWGLHNHNYCKYRGLLCTKCTKKILQLSMEYYQKQLADVPKFQKATDEEIEQLKTARSI